MWYRLQVRLTPADVGKRVVIRWRRPGPGDGEQIAHVLGILEEADAGSFAVRTRDGTLIVIPAGRALPGKWCHHHPSAGAAPDPSLPDRRPRRRGMATFPLPIDGCSPHT